MLYLDFVLFVRLAKSGADEPPVRSDPTMTDWASTLGKEGFTDGSKEVVIGEVKVQ